MTPSLSLWSPPPDRLTLAGGQLHLWRFRLDLSPNAIAGLSPLLSADERRRADRLLDPAKAERFIVARARMRLILGRYLDLKPAELSFRYAEQGKPSLNTTQTQRLAFNLAHAGDLGVLAITAGIEVGVDIEQIDARLDCTRIAANVFDPDEISRFEQYPPLRRVRGFYRIWTRKEAALKLTGYGFSTPRQKGSGDGRRVTRSFTIGRNYLGAVAVAAEVAQIHRWNFA